MSWGDTDGEGIRIKICGVRCKADIDSAVDAGADAVGLVRCMDSPRHIDLDTAIALVEHCGDAIVPVTLLVNPTAQELRALPTTWVQLHGQETAATIADAAQSYSVIKAVPAHNRVSVVALNADSNVHRLLIDAPRGGSGETFDHGAMAQLRHTLHTPLIIAGGLTEANVAEAVATLQPWGVDVSSGVETQRGVKDAAIIKAFCKAARGS